MPISAVLFDKDGTFVDFHKTWAPAAHVVLQSLSEGDAALLASLAEAVHFDLADRTFRDTSPFIAASNREIAAIWAPLLRAIDIDGLSESLSRQLREASIAMLAPIGRPADVFLALARRGLRLGIATNDAEATARQQAEALEILVHIDFVAGYDSGWGGKPDPGMVHAFADHLAIPEREIALVGDSRHDLEAARRAGALAIAVLSGPAGRPELEPHADHVIASIDALPALIDELRRVAGPLQHRMSP
jgi:phosphoglycolate phosphatase